MKIRSKTILAVAVAVVALPLALAATEGQFARTLQVTGPVDLNVSTGAGSITVRAGGSGQVRINGYIKAKRGREAAVRALEANPPIEQEGNWIRIGRIEDDSLRKNITISYELVVPQETRLKSGTGSGEQKVSGILGPVEASTGSGSVSLTNIGDEVDASTGSGNIHLEGIRGAAQASTGSGSIRATDIAGAMKASTGSGDVRLEQSAPGDVSVSTGSGDVDIHGVEGAVRVRTGSGDLTADGDPTGEWDLDTSSGEITLRLPAGAAFDLVAKTSSGSIYIGDEHELVVSGKINPRRIRGKVRGGGVRLALSTSSGDIRIE
jgi:DUF4097 and DUF4098 domain-containing protein YvlB